MRRGLTHMMMALAVTAMLVAGCGDAPMVEDTVQMPDTDIAPEDEAGPEISEIEPGKQAPDFTAPLVGGGEVSLSDYEGRVLVLDFWATWCGACVDELPEYQALYEQWDQDEVAYIAMSADGDMSTVEAFLEGHPDWTMPFALPSDEMLDAYLPMRTLPASRVIDGDGVIRYEFKGAAADKVAEAVKRLQAEGEGADEGQDG